MSYAVIDSAVGIDADLIAGLLVDPPPPPPPAAGLTAVLEVAVMVGAAIFGMLADPPPPPAGLVAVLDVAAVVDSSVLASLADPPPPPAGLVAVLDVAAVVDSSVLASLADPPPPPAGLVAVLDVAAVVDSSVLASLADPPPPPAGLVAVLDVAAVVDSSVLASLADPPPPPAVPVMVCPVGATALLMAGYPHLFDGGNLFIGVPAQWVVASVAGKRMKFRSEETAESWVELVVIRAASEIGLASALPVASRDKWKAKKLESLAGYQDRMVQAAAKLPAGSAGQVAILAEFAIVQEKIDSL